MMGIIRVNRNPEWIHKVRSIEIYIDDKKVGNILEGETRDFEVSEEQHEIYVRIDWCRSQKIVVQITQDEVKDINISGFKFSKWILPVLLGIILCYFITKYTLGIDLVVLLWMAFVGLLYPIYYITLGKNKYLVVSEKVD